MNLIVMDMYSAVFTVVTSHWMGISSLLKYHSEERFKLQKMIISTLVTLVSNPVCIVGNRNYMTNYSLSECIPRVAGCNYSVHVHCSCIL